MPAINVLALLLSTLSLCPGPNIQGDQCQIVLCFSYWLSFLKLISLQTSEYFICVKYFFSREFSLELLFIFLNTLKTMGMNIKYVLLCSIYLPGTWRCLTFKRSMCTFSTQITKIKISQYLIFIHFLRQLSKAESF